MSRRRKPWPAPFKTPPAPAQPARTDGLRSVEMTSIADQLDEVDPRVRGMIGKTVRVETADVVALRIVQRVDYRNAGDHYQRQEAPPMSSARVTAKTCKVCGESKPLDQFPKFGPHALRCVDCAAKAPAPSPAAAKSRKQRAKKVVPPMRGLIVRWSGDRLNPTAPNPAFDELLVDLKALREERDELRAQVNRLYADLQAIVK